MVVSDNRLPDDVNLRWVGTCLMTMTAEIRDVQQRLGSLEQRFTAIEYRLSALEHRFSAMEARFGGMEDRMTSMLAVIVRIAERLDGSRSQ
jgi:DNA anti-recombination protein RmuC